MELKIDLLEGVEDEMGNAVMGTHRSAVVHIQVVCILSFQILHLHHELCDAQTKADHQLIILKMKRKLAQLGNN